MTMDSPHLFLLLWAVLAFYVLGEIWFCQIVIYPLFAKVGAADYIRYHGYYTQRIPLPVIVPGFLSFLLPIPLALFGPTVPVWMSVANIGTGLVGLLVTVLLEIPRHGRLEKAGKNDVTIAELIRYNWPRTLSISGQSLVTLLMLHHVFSVG
jgi:hypothetical protein